MKKLLLGLAFLLVPVSLLMAGQHDYVINDNPGAIVRTDINNVLQAIVTNNSGATAPSPTFPNMWWYDTSTGLLKRRNNANDAWITLGLEAADTDGTLAANSDSKIATQKATKTYTDTKAAKGANSDITSLSGLTTPLSRAQGGLASTVANNAANGPVFLDSSSRLPAVDGSLLTGLSTVTQVNDIETTGVNVSWGSETTVLSIAKTITPGKTVLVLGSGYFVCNDGAIRTYIRAYQGATKIQEVIGQPYGSYDNGRMPWAITAIVTGLSGSITFSITGQTDWDDTSKIYGNLIVLEF
jgi:hypothetical protein